MNGPSTYPEDGLSPDHAAAQYGPRPLPLFLELLRSETAASPGRRAAAMAGLARLQAEPRLAPPASVPVLAQVGNARLLDYGGSGPVAIFVPSLINPALILDLAEDMSLMRWLAGQGVRPLLVDWGEPDDPTLDLAGHVERRLLPLLDAIPDQPILVGYCLGGTLAIAAAAVRPVRALALIAAPWNFQGYGNTARAEIADLWKGAASPCQTLGHVPMEVLQAGFWQLDPARTIDKYTQLSTLAPGSAALQRFVAVEDWANSGAPLTFPAGRDLFERLVGADDSGQRRWRVGGQEILPERLTIPILNILSTTDRITPVATAITTGETMRLDLGHVGMIVGSRARQSLWQPLADWLKKPHVPAQQA